MYGKKDRSTSMYGKKDGSFLKYPKHHKLNSNDNGIYLPVIGVMLLVLSVKLLLLVLSGPNDWAWPRAAREAVEKARVFSVFSACVEITNPS